MLYLRSRNCILYGDGEMWQHHVQTCMLSTAVALAEEKTDFEPVGQTCNVGHHNSWKKIRNCDKNLYFRTILTFVYNHYFLVLSTCSCAYFILCSHLYLYWYFCTILLFSPSFIPHITLNGFESHFYVSDKSECQIWALWGLCLEQLICLQISNICIKIV